VTTPSDAHPVADRMSRPVKSAFALAVLAPILVIAALTLPWWNFYGLPTDPAQRTPTSFVREELGLGFVCATNAGNRACFLYPWPFGPTGAPELSSLFALASALIFAAVFLSLLNVVLLAIALFRPTLAWLTLPTSLLGAALTLSAAAYVALTLPRATNGLYFAVPVRTFFGADSADGWTYSWGAGVGWYVTIIAGELFLGSALASRSAAKDLRRHGNLTFVELLRLCPNCSVLFAPGQRFCGNCGSPVMPPSAPPGPVA